MSEDYPVYANLKDIIGCAGFVDDGYYGYDPTDDVDNEWSKNLEKSSEDYLKCPFCDKVFTRAELRENGVRENFEFKTEKNWNNQSWLCCNLCEAPVEELEKVDDVDEDFM